VSVWQDVVNLHFPDSAWLRCSRDTLDALSAFKSKRALPTWDATLTALLAQAAESDRASAPMSAPEAPTVDAKPRDSVGGTAPAVDVPPRDSVGDTEASKP
jgi:Family of unknown function (DUF6084)